MLKACAGQEKVSGFGGRGGGGWCCAHLATPAVTGLEGRLKRHELNLGQSGKISGFSGWV